MLSQYEYCSRYPSYPQTGTNVYHYVENNSHTNSKWQEEDDEFNFLEAYWVAPKGISERQFAVHLISTGKVTESQMRYIERNNLNVKQPVEYKQVTIEQPIKEENVKIQKINYNDFLDTNPVSESREDEWDLEEEINVPDLPPGYFINGGKVYDNISDCPTTGLTVFHPLMVGGNPDKKKRNYKKKNNRRRRANPKKRYPDCSPGNVYETTANLTTNGSGDINLLVALNNPTQILAGVTATGAQDLADNWDAYSVEKVVMKTQILAPIVARQGQWNLFVDHDSSPPTVSVSQALCNTYRDRRIFSSQAQPSWSVVPRKLTQAEYISGIGADAEPAVIVSKGKYDWNTPPANGFMYIKLSNGPISTTIGTINVRVYVTTWFKRRLALADPGIAVPYLLPPPEDSSDEEEEVKKKRKKKT